MMFGGKTDLETSCQIINRAMESGINLLDTANVYSGGRSEEFTGEALQRNGKRQRIVLATKVFNRMSDDPNGWGNTRRHIIEQCEASLRRLRTDWIDLYQIHRPQSEVPIDETLRALDDLVRAGKVRYAGTSTFAAWQIVESLWVSKELGLHRFVCEQPPYNLLDRRIERELVPMALSFGIGLIPWSPLAGGLLTGKYAASAPPPEGTRFADMEKSAVYQRRYVRPALEAMERFKSLCREQSLIPSRLALAWVISRPGISSAIIGPRTAEQFEDNLAALDLRMTPELEAALDEIVPPGRVVAPYYEADFGPHRWRW
jgi:aryl-alcohol dehydrogenase-like predicted oxidoreductase